MYAGKLCFAQLMEFLPRHEFNACVRRYDGDRRLLTAAIAVAMIGLIEILQFWAPGRHARLEDFVVDALAACAGLAIAAGVGWVVGRSRQAKVS